MKVVFANDTSGTSNPGCQGTVAGLMDCLEGAGQRVISRLPFGYRYGRFAQCFENGVDPRGLFPGQGRLLTAWHVLRTGQSGDWRNTEPRRISVSRWQAEISYLTAHVAPLMVGCDTLVVNGEGTVHDDSVGALALVGLCVAAKRLGKTVRLLNSSIFSLDRALLDALRDNVDDIAVREPISLRYLRENGVYARLTADCLFLAGEQSGQDVYSGWEKREKRRAIYTPGVLSGSGRVAKEAVGRDIRELVQAGYEVIYYVIELEDEPLVGAAVDAGASVVPLAAFSWQKVIPFMKTADVVVSGRYHINIFAALAGTPFIPLETNTPKMVGLLQLLGMKEDHPVRLWTAHENSIASLDMNAAVRVEATTLSQCIELAKSAVD